MRDQRVMGESERKDAEFENIVKNVRRRINVLIIVLGVVCVVVALTLVWPIAIPVVKALLLRDDGNAVRLGLSPFWQETVAVVVGSVCGGFIVEGIGSLIVKLRYFSNVSEINTTGFSQFELATLYSHLQRMSRRQSEWATVEGDGPKLVYRLRVMAPSMVIALVTVIVILLK